MEWQNENINQTRDRIRRSWGDYPLTILIINPINLRLLRLIGNSRIKPNQLTLISFAVMVLAAICLASVLHGVQAVGGVLILIAFLIDCLDGDLARFKDLKSPLGAMLDPILDRFGEVVLITGMAISGWRATNDPFWLIGGIFLVGASQIYFYLVDAIVWKLPEKKDKSLSSQHMTLWGTRVRFGAIEPFIWGETILAFFGVAHWGIPIFSVMFTLGCIKVFYGLFKKARSLDSEDLETYGVHTR